MSKKKRKQTRKNPKSPEAEKLKELPKTGGEPLAAYLAAGFVLLAVFFQVQIAKYLLGIAVSIAAVSFVMAKKRRWVSMVVFLVAFTLFLISLLMPAAL